MKQKIEKQTKSMKTKTVLYFQKIKKIDRTLTRHYEKEREDTNYQYRN